MRADSCRLMIKVIPSSSRDSISGWSGNTLRVRVRAPPEKGRANKAVTRLLAKRFGLATKDVVIVSGLTRQIKCIELSSITESEVRSKLPDQGKYPHA